MDTSQDTIQELFFSQVNKMTKKSLNIRTPDSFDIQFSDRWINR